MDPTDAKVSSVLAAIEGDEVAAERIPDVLREHADVGRLRELYDVRENELTGGGSLLDAIVTRIAVRDVL